MPVCPNCGNQAADTAVFCDQCGAKLAVAETPAPAAAVPEAPVGGVPEDIVICPACGAENVPGEVFCDVCGEPLEAPEPVATQVVAEPAAVETAVEAEPVIEAEPVVEAELVIDAELVTEDEPVAEDTVIEETVIEETVVEQAPADAQETYCPACGAVVHPDDTFCGNCGASLGAAPQEEWEEAPIVEEAPIEELPVQETPIETIVEEIVIEEEPVAEQEIDAETVVEEEPTEAVVVEEEELACPVCGANVLPDQRFCASCGATLEPVEQAAPTPEAPAAPSGLYLSIVATGAHIPLVDQPELLIGREDDISGVYPDVNMTPHGGEDGGVSRRHAKLVHEKDGWFIVDLDSTNGTYVNETEVPPKGRAALKDGDTIGLGDIEAVFHAAG